MRQQDQSSTFPINGIEMEFLTISNDELIIGSGVEGQPAIKESEYINEIIIKSEIISNGHTFRITEINNFAFYNANIQKIIFEGAIRKVGRSAFEKSKIVDIEFVKSAFEEIPEDCFYKCNDLMKVEFYNPIKIVGKRAFYRSPISLFNFNDVESIGKYSFAYTDISTVEFLSKKLIVLSEGCFCGSAIKTINLPSNLQIIESYCFSESHLTTITTSHHLKSIGEGAFMDCMSLKNADFSRSILYSNVQDSTFENSFISEVKLPKSTVCLQSRCFFRCAQLKNIEMPENLEEIGESSFESCNNLDNVDLTNTRCAKISEKAFFKCYELSSVTFPDELCIIESNAFAHSSIIAVILTSCSKIRNEAFLICDRLTVVDIEKTDVTSLPSGVFKECKALKLVLLPEKLKIIGEYSFAYCISLVDIKFPDVLEVIEQYGFHGCKDLQSIDLYFTSLTNFTSYVFQDCANLETITFPQHENCITLSPFAFFNSGLIKVKIPSTCIRIGMHCFEYCKKLKSIDISECQIIEIEKCTLNECYNLEEIILPRTLKRLWYTCLSGTNFESFTCSTLDTLGSSIFYGCKNLTKANFTGCTFSYIGLSCFYQCPLKEVVLPATVQELKRGAFCKCTNLVTIKMPDSLITIEGELFMDCTSLVTVDFRNTKLREINSRSFSNCINLKNIYWSTHLGKIGDYVFYQCPKINNISLTSQMILSDSSFSTCGVVKVNMTDFSGHLPMKIFYECNRLEKIYWPKRSFSIGEKAFAKCISLKTVILPNTLIEMSDSAFRGNEKMSHFDMGQTSLSKISNYILSGNMNLSSVVLPLNVTFFGDSAFFECPITDIYYFGVTDFSKIKNPFDNSKLNIHVTINYIWGTFAGIDVIQDIEDAPFESSHNEIISTEEVESSFDYEAHTSDSILSENKEENDVNSIEDNENPSLIGEESSLLEKENEIFTLSKYETSSVNDFIQDIDENNNEDEDSFTVWPFISGAFGGTILFIGIIVVSCSVAKRKRIKFEDGEALVSGVAENSLSLSNNPNLNEQSTCSLWNDYIIRNENNIIKV